MYEMGFLADNYQSEADKILDPEVRRLLQQGVNDLRKEEVYLKRHLIQALVVGMRQTYEAGRRLVGEPLPVRQDPQTIAEDLARLKSLEKKIGETFAPAVQNFLNIVRKEGMEIPGGYRGSVLRLELQILVEAMEQAFEVGRKQKRLGAEQDNRLLSPPVSQPGGTASCPHLSPQGRDGGKHIE